MSRSTLLLIGLAAGIAAASACSTTGSGNDIAASGSTSGSGTGGKGAGGAAVSSSSSAGGAAVSSSSANGGSSGSGGSGCANDPNVDGDGDGWTGAQGDCNDCDPNVNPGAIEVMTPATSADGGVATPVDENCDMLVDNVPGPCDQNLALDDTDPFHAAQAIELCQQTTADAKTWGLLDAKYVRADGTAVASPGAQVGIQPSFGPNVTPRAGQRILMLSSGEARVPGQPGACGSLTCMSNTNGTPPPGFPQDNPNCPPSTYINDDIGLEVKLRAPTNATGYSFSFKFYSFEYPEWVCNQFNDQFIALANPPPQGSINGNISFDSMHNAVSVNLGFFDVCDPNGIGNYAAYCSGNCPLPPNPYCPMGTAELQGTGFDVWNDAGGTAWLVTQAPIKGGDAFSIRFTIWDAGDQQYDSSVLIDNFQWIANGGTVVVGTKN